MIAQVHAEVRRRWAEAAGVSDEAFSRLGLHVTPAPHGRTTPPDWFGAIAVGDRVLITAPDENQARALIDALADALTDSAARSGEQLLAAVSTGALAGVSEVLGPAWLSYASPRNSPRVVPSASAVSWPVASLNGDDSADLAALVGACSPEDVDESGIEELGNLRVVREAGVIVAAAGWQQWPGEVAHMGVLAAPSARGHGAAFAVTEMAVAAALGRGLLVQWRARPPASRRLAQRVGLIEVGWQVSWR